MLSKTKKMAETIQKSSNISQRNMQRPKSNKTKDLINKFSRINKNQDNRVKMGYTSPTLKSRASKTKKYTSLYINKLG